MLAGLTCVAAVAIAAVFAVPGTKERRSYSDGLYWSPEDASVAGDSFLDCSDDDSDSVELAYIINKREAPTGPTAARLVTVIPAPRTPPPPPPPQATGTNNAALTTSVTGVLTKKQI